VCGRLDWMGRGHSLTHLCKSLVSSTRWKLIMIYLIVVE